MLISTLARTCAPSLGSYSFNKSEYSAQHVALEYDNVHVEVREGPGNPNRGTSIRRSKSSRN